jgi:hypothetical protein
MLKSMLEVVVQDQLGDKIWQNQIEWEINPLNQELK